MVNKYNFSHSSTCRFCDARPLNRLGTSYTTAGNNPAEVIVIRFGVLNRCSNCKNSICERVFGKDNGKCVSAKIYMPEETHDQIMSIVSKLSGQQCTDKVSERLTMSIATIIDQVKNKRIRNDYRRILPTAYTHVLQRLQMEAPFSYLNPLTWYNKIALNGVSANVWYADEEPEHSLLAVNNFTDAPSLLPYNLRQAQGEEDNEEAGPEASGSGDPPDQGAGTGLSANDNALPIQNQFYIFSSQEQPQLSITDTNTDANMSRSNCYFSGISGILMQNCMMPMRRIDLQNRIQIAGARDLPLTREAQESPASSSNSSPLLSALESGSSSSGHVPFVAQQSQTQDLIDAFTATMQSEAEPVHQATPTSYIPDDLTVGQEVILERFREVTESLENEEETEEDPSEPSSRQRERDSWTTSFRMMFEDISFDLGRDPEEYEDAMSDLFRQTTPQRNRERGHAPDQFWQTNATGALFYGNRLGVHVYLNIPGIALPRRIYMTNTQYQPQSWPTIQHPHELPEDGSGGLAPALDPIPLPYPRNERFPGHPGYLEKLRRTAPHNVLPNGVIMSIRQRRTRDGQRRRAQARRRELLPGDRRTIIDNIRSHEVTEEIAAEVIEECCVICNQPFLQAENYSTLRCGHSYHTECVQQWFRTGRTEGSDHCPICRSDAFDTTGPVTRALIEALDPFREVREVLSEGSMPAQLPFSAAVE